MIIYLKCKCKLQVEQNESCAVLRSFWHICIHVTWVHLSGYGRCLTCSLLVLLLFASKQINSRAKYSITRFLTIQIAKCYRQLIICSLSVLIYMRISLCSRKNLARLSLSKLLMKLRQAYFACWVLEITLKLCIWRGLYFSVYYSNEYQL